MNKESIQYTHLYKAANGPEAYLLKGIMENNNIEATVTGEYLASAMGELPVEVSQLDVLVNSKKVAEALMILEGFKESNRESEDKWIECNHCGNKVPTNFDCCWQCQSDL
tara:strand:+ start:646 stop:975 length:330 start_codon:yes stop_codon:yes gene_type:complete